VNRTGWNYERVSGRQEDPKRAGLKPLEKEVHKVAEDVNT